MSPKKPRLGERKLKPYTFGEEPELTNRGRSQISERETARVVGGKTTSNSGATPFEKGDVHSRRFLWEDKTTKGSNLNLPGSVVAKVCREAAMAGKTPGIVLSMEGLPDHVDSRWVCVPAHVWEELREQLGW